MKKLYKYLLIGLLSIPLTPINSFSQSIDTNRMNRDINIMENILGELFKAQISSSSEGTIIINGRGFGGGNSTRGTYLPGFGVIFMVSKPTQNLFPARSGSGSNSSNYVFYYNTNSDENLEIDQESVTTRIKEFLRDYASTIGQLKKDDKVMVIYGSKSNLSEALYYRMSASSGRVSTDKKEALPVISVSAEVSDLLDYRSGKLNSNNFDSRLAVATSENKEYLDLKVMGNIFETALNEQDKEAFRISGSVDYLMLDNFGALYSIDVRYDEFGRSASVIWEIEGRLRSRLSSEREVLEQAKNNELEDAAEHEKRKQELEKKISTAYTNLVSNIKEYIVDYGRTLNSLSSDQFLLLSININGRYENIPGRLDIQIKKSVLEQLDKGSISREQALERVVVTEY
tara:strand:+ start:6435 stop:7637 length:1203 start_codon:yes stop_codon:yes gene_type:complete